MRGAFVSAVALTLALSPALSLGGVVQIQSNTSESTGHSGFFAGTVDFSPASSTMGFLTISIANTSPVEDGGYVTGIVFDVPSKDPEASASLVSVSQAGFLLLTAPNAAPFGQYDFGAALGGDWLGGGSPLGGVGVGESATFVFKITASDVPDLSALDFVLGADPSGILTRFKGFNSDNSDKVPAAPVPAPGAVAVSLAGLLIAAGRRSR